MLLADCLLHLVCLAVIACQIPVKYPKALTYYGYDAPLKRLQQFREHRLLTILEHDPKSGTAAIFQLKQTKNGGYTDSPINTGDQGATITLRIQGVGGADAFK